MGGRGQAGHRTAGEAMELSGAGGCAARVRSDGSKGWPNANGSKGWPTAPGAGCGSHLGHAPPSGAAGGAAGPGAPGGSGVGTLLAILEKQQEGRQQQQSAAQHPRRGAARGAAARGVAAPVGAAGSGAKWMERAGAAACGPRAAAREAETLAWSCACPISTG